MAQLKMTDASNPNLVAPTIAIPMRVNI